VLVFLALLALATLLLNLPRGLGWSEIPDDHVLLVVRDGTVNATLDGSDHVLSSADRAIVGNGDRVAVRDGSLALLIFRGGAEARLCPRTRVLMGRVGADGLRPVRPAARLGLVDGQVVTSTGSTSTAFAPVALATKLDVGQLRNRGAARFSFTRRVVKVSAGEVELDAQPVPVTGGIARCDARATPNTSERSHGTGTPPIEPLPPDLTPTTTPPSGVAPAPPRTPRPTSRDATTPKASTPAPTSPLPKTPNATIPDPAAPTPTPPPEPTPPPSPPPDSTPPFAVIFDPPSGALFGPGTPITFYGFGFDAEDGALPQEAMLWFSQIDGFLGTGSVIQAVLSSPSCDGTFDHRVVLEVQDHDGNVTTAAIDVHVGDFIC
jgi:putative peptide zinc metalloprotease protein